MTIPSRRKIKAFLKEFKDFSDKKFEFVDRPKNMQLLMDLNINDLIAKEIILNLTHKNYSNGPEKDRDREKGNVWKFGSRINGEEVYIKLSDDFTGDKARCISFHKAEFKIEYPYKDRGGR